MFFVKRKFVFWYFYHSTTYQPPVPKPSSDGRLPERVVAAHSPSRNSHEIAKNAAEDLKTLTFKANESAMCSRLRIINTTLYTYSAEHSDTYPASLADLGRAGLIDADLVTGSTGGYAYTYTIGIAGYSLWARPEIYNRSGAESCVTNQSAEIHCTFENRYATFDDPAE
jgi:hypothetical protein